MHSKGLKITYTLTYFFFFLQSFLGGIPFSLASSSTFGAQFLRRCTLDHIHLNGPIQKLWGQIFPSAPHIRFTCDVMFRYSSKTVFRYTNDPAGSVGIQRVRRGSHDSLLKFFELSGPVDSFNYTVELLISWKLIALLLRPSLERTPS